MSLHKSSRAGIALGVLLGMLLGGCADPRLNELKQTLDAIREAPGGEPLIVIPVIPDYHGLEYRYGDARSPFLPREVLDTSRSDERYSSELAPDQQRTREPLEQFDLQELRLVGTLRMGARRIGLIETPMGEVVSVREGNYLGTDYGVIGDIGENGIAVVERIYTDRTGWRERDVELTLDNDK
ncbi:pilus assembly protein PilP [Halomonas sp. Bachu 37]|uniref:pilus assembly protein PilP n=1 Tax=Halomonas kashgarensis TaxID=3084920 RepID=UPI003217BBBD